MNDVNPCSTIEYWKACNEIIGKVDCKARKPCYNGGRVCLLSGEKSLIIIIIIIIIFNTSIALFTFTYDQKRFTNFKNPI